SDLIGFDWRSTRVPWRQRLGALGDNLRRSLLQSAFLVVTLVHQAGTMIDAIVRTLWRLGVTRRRMLDWVTAEQAARTPEMSVVAFYRCMMPSFAVGVIGAIVAFSSAMLTGLVALPFALAWVAAPALVYV